MQSGQVLAVIQGGFSRIRWQVGRVRARTHVSERKTDARGPEHLAGGSRVRGETGVLFWMQL